MRKQFIVKSPADLLKAKMSKVFKLPLFLGLKKGVQPCLKPFCCTPSKAY